MPDLEDIQRKIIAFRSERDWAQFHDPKNLAEALSIWNTTEQFRKLTEVQINKAKAKLDNIFTFRA